MITTIKRFACKVRSALHEAKRIVADVRSALPSTPEKNENSVLIVRVDAIGDYMLFRQCLRGLRHAPCFRGKKIVLCGNAVWQPLAEALDGEAFDEFVPVRRYQFVEDENYRHALLSEIRARGFSLALQPTYSRDYIGDSLVMASGAPERIGFDGPCQNMAWTTRFFFNRRYTSLIAPASGYPFELDRNAEVLSYLGVAGHDIPPFQDRFPERLLNGLPASVASALGLPVFFIGASSPAKQWPWERFAELANFVADRYGMQVALEGGAVALEAMNRIADQCPETAVPLAGTSLVELAALVARAPLLVSNDSVAAHMGAIYGVPTVILSNGLYQGRFHPYPVRLAPRSRTVYPRPLRETDPCKYYHSDSPYPVSTVMQEDVIRAICDLCG